jgi:hypothetical protein
MAGRPRSALRRLYARLGRIERREVKEFRDWIEHTGNLIHVSVLIFLPLLIGLVTYLSNLLDAFLPFLLFPPLASGTHTLFANPESKYASPRRFVGGLTLGAICGWIALEVTARYWYAVPPGSLEAHAGAAAFSVFLTGVLTWVLDVEESAAFSTALLVLVTGTNQVLYVASVAVSTTLIAGVFLLWRDRFYEQRADYLYQTTKSDDHVLVPMRGENPHATAMLGGGLAAPHDAGKVVLLDVLDEEAIEEARADLQELPADGGGRGSESGDGEEGHAHRVEASPAHGGYPTTGEAATEIDEAREYAVARAATTLEGRAKTVEEKFGVPCEVIVAFGGGDPARTVLEAVQDANCDLVAASYEATDDHLTGFLRGLLSAEVDVLVHNSHDGRTAWSNALVPVAKTGDVAHAMIDFARRLVRDGEISVCHCLETGNESDLRDAEEMLANLTEAFSGSIETRVARTPIETFLERNDDRYDVVFLGASTDRSAASRFLSKPTFQRVSDVDADVAIVHRG